MKSLRDNKKKKRVQKRTVVAGVPDECGEPVGRGRTTEKENRTSHNDDDDGKDRCP